MSFRIFISHSTEDQRIAEEVARVLNNAFEGHVEPYLAFHEIGGGDEWKEEIKKNLQLCDAIICIVTPESQNKPWLFIEWSAFWLAEKKYYILLSDEVKVSDLIQPMQDRQATGMLDETSVRMFFRRLTDDSGYGTVPYNYVNRFVDSVRDAIQLQANERAEQSYARYRASLAGLPADDTQKCRIADYFYRSGELDIWNSIVREIRDDSVKADMAIQLVRAGDMEGTFALCQSMRGADKLGLVATEIIDQGHMDSTQLRQIAEVIATRNQAELRKIAIHVAELGEEDTDLFRYVCGLISNIAELRKVVIFFVENHRIDSPVFEDLIERFESNLAELRKIAFEFIANGLQRSGQFQLIIEILIQNQREIEKVMAELFRHDQELFSELMARRIIVNEMSLKRLEQLGRRN